MGGKFPLSPYFGNYPDGPCISAFPPPGVTLDDDDELRVVGTLRFRMPEDDVDFPLWDDDGPMPDDPEDLHAGVGLSAHLVADLSAWGAAWNQRRGLSSQELEAHRAGLRAEAVALVDRMRLETHEGIEVELDLR